VEYKRSEYYLDRISKLIENYVEERTWTVKENANTSKTFTGLVHYLTLETLRDFALSLYKNEGKLHVEGFIHVHDLPFSPFIGYCAGWSIRRLLEKGLITPTIAARPAKHLDSACDHIANFLCTAAHEWAGAQAFSKVDLYLAPFVSYDKIHDYKRIKQQIQRLVYNLNFPSRVGSQTPFTNFTFVLDLVPQTLEERAIIGGKNAEPLGSYIEECIKVVNAFCDVLLDGDALGQPFTFPIPTLLITKRFDWNGYRWGELANKIWEVCSKRGSWYFLNCVNGVDPNSIFSMCCRLTIDKGKLVKICQSKHFGGVWTSPDETGSIGVVTLNMARLGYLSKGSFEKLYELLDDLLLAARDHLMKKRVRLEHILKSSAIDLPITRHYLGDYSHHYSTIGLTALPEFIVNFTQNPGIWIDSRTTGEIIRIYRRTLTYIQERIKEFEEEDQILYNIEETPAESAGIRMAKIDKKQFSKDVEELNFYIPEWNGEPFYSNSIVPYYAEVPLYRRIEIESEVQKYFTGGVMMHVFLNEVPDQSALKRVCRKIVDTNVIYFSFTPTQSNCMKCKWRAVGVYWICPKCGSKTEVWSRIVGYYRPIRNWNSGRLAEFMRREVYDLSVAT